MNNYPNFSDQGYQIIREFGHNNIGGRVTYLAENIHTQKNVVIKQFQFAKLGATWAEYDAYEQEIAVLKSLNHPGIPQYLDSFQTADGFCMIQEYIDAESAVISRQWQPQEIKQIAISILEILIYLQNQPQPVIHRDIKPENILIDEELKVYLVDFGFARMGGGEIAASSVVKGTMGFMSPEQMFNRKLTTASDLYSLGATLICLLTGIKSADIGNLIDANYRIIFRHLVPPLERGWINWLEKITEPKYTDRYENAEAALIDLLVLNINRLPKVRISRTNLEFASDKWGEKLTEIIIVSNPIPETILFGRLEVAPHVNDPPHTPYEHSWISFSSQKFEGNNVECKITLDTSKLVENEIHKRKIFLHSNSTSEIETINVKVKTGSVPKLKYISIFMFFLGEFVLMGTFVFFGYNLFPFNPLFGLSLMSIFWALISMIWVVISIPLDAFWEHSVTTTGKIFIKNLLFSEQEKKLIFLLTIGFYLSLGVTLKNFLEVLLQLHCFTLGQILVSLGIAIVSMFATLIPLIYLVSKPIKIFFKYRKAEPNLIQP
ncbi:MAG: serine/threonine protein kinase [Okeania sp. SIO3I5]|uniref:serine/threonine protein kinase n=1 Tax=Okeania sp. SIO3I5 TaxID=2607805 RepID=UPI0013BB27EA|nr:serine/threonine-protein kinase [Okeania sp. SIO3I5]NEQ38437.1 serine/threonine protein kinase [Okeania sp. SIO3I5]